MSCFVRSSELKEEQSRSGDTAGKASTLAEDNVYESNENAFMLNFGERM